MKNLKKIILVVAMLMATVSSASAFYLNGKKVLWTGEFKSEYNLPVGKIHGWIKEYNGDLYLVCGDVFLDVHTIDSLGNWEDGTEKLPDMDLKVRSYPRQLVIFYVPVIIQVDRVGVVTKIYCDDDDYTEYDDKLCRHFGYSQRGVFTYP